MKPIVRDTEETAATAVISDMISSVNMKKSKRQTADRGLVV